MAPYPPRLGFQDLHHLMLDALFGGTIRLGERLSISPLASRFGVSPTPLREVLSRLVGQGLVEERRAEGYYVVRMDGRSIAQFYDLHALYIDLALRAGRRRAAVADHSNAWAAFAELIQTSPNAAIRASWALVDLRLRLVRRCEAQLVDDARQQRELIALLAAGELMEARRAVRSFHKVRAVAAELIAFEASRPNESK